MSQFFNIFFTRNLLTFGLLVELLRNGAELLAAILVHARDFASDAFEILSSLP